MQMYHCNDNNVIYKYSVHVQAGTVQLTGKVNASQVCHAGVLHITCTCGNYSCYIRGLCGFVMRIHVHTYVHACMYTYIHIHVGVINFSRHGLLTRLDEERANFGKKDISAHTSYCWLMEGI